jgi:hypothetical protein
MTESNHLIQLDPPVRGVSHAKASGAASPGVMWQGELGTSSQEEAVQFAETLRPA